MSESGYELDLRKQLNEAEDALAKAERRVGELERALRKIASEYRIGEIARREADAALSIREQVMKVAPDGVLLTAHGYRLPGYELVAPGEVESVLSPDQTIEKLGEKCERCEGDGECICVLCDPEDERYNGSTVKCGEHRFVYVDHDEYGEGCHGTGCAHPDLYVLIYERRKKQIDIGLERLDRRRK